MRYISVTCEQREAMLRTLGVSDIEELFGPIPADARMTRPLALPSGMSEIDLTSHLRRLAADNVPASSLVSFAGGGCYDHYVPSVVEHVLARPEFFTAYTPYQAEASQGTLQAIWEYQTMICELTGMDVANASMYDGATALVEAALMACRLTKRKKVVASCEIHPQWMETLSTYATSGLMDVVATSVSTHGNTDLSSLRDHVDDETAAVLIASPNFLGVLEDLRSVADLARAAGALTVVVANPIMLGVMEPPASYGSDIVVGEGQPLGNAMSYGGPGLGFFACRQDYVRQMPGRLVGRTTDLVGNTAYVLTVATREQHIRREKATSNICSNHALNALAAAVYLSAVGSRGLAQIAGACVSKAHYLRERLLQTGAFTALWAAPFGYEFVLRYAGDVEAMQKALLSRGYVAGIDLPDRQAVLFAVTEKRTRAEIDSFVAEVGSL